MVPVDMNIVGLMHVKRSARDVAWLRQSLQWAIALEHATIPPYLSAVWSIRSQSGTVYDRIEGIVLQEMLHMALACNMLTAIGGDPQIAVPGFVPAYPSPLPGGVRPGLIVPLQGLTRDVVERVFMQIELPEWGPVAMYRRSSPPTVGAFYSAILDAFRRIKPEIMGTRRQQQGLIGPNHLYAIQTMDDVERAILNIKEQGEGTSRSPYVEHFDPNALAHYYTFSEIWHGRTLIKNVAGNWVYEGTPIDFPDDVWPMAPVPEGGYPGVPEAHAFNLSYATMLEQLHRAWNEDGASYRPAVRTMFELAEPATALMAKPLPGGGGNYGPDFRFIARSAATSPVT